ncbi:hypothetical protein Drorol1_Dr00002552 [Drosera rotundifolia]
MMATTTPTNDDDCLRCLQWLLAEMLLWSSSNVHELLLEQSGQLRPKYKLPYVDLASGEENEDNSEMEED